MNRRIITALVIVIAMLLCVYAIQTETPQMQERSYIILPHDTLWGIAQIYCPANMDVRDWIYRVRRANNNLDAGALMVGSEIIVLEGVE